MTRRKVNHFHDIVARESTSLGVVDFGDIIEFKYSGQKVYDLKPLVYILEKKGDLVKGINLNYLTEYKVQQLLQEQSKKKFQWYELYDTAIRSYKKNKMKMINRVLYGRDEDAT